MARVIAEICESSGHTPLIHHSGEKALNAISGMAPHLVLTDVRMDGMGGLEVLRICRETMQNTPVIVITANRQLQVGIDAMKAGAFDYITKPFKVDEMRIAIERALSHHADHREIIALRQSVREKYRFENLVGLSRKMQELFGLVAKVADTDSTILIEGESGTGKELVARALHFNSKRQSKPLVALNCSALPDNLLESELFGHKRGSFTGAVADKIGLFEEAEGGTIFLDEVSSMSPFMQSKLLRVLQERIIRRVGDTKTIPIQVRVLAATNEPLLEKARAGHFREDLYYRLAVIPMSLPPLRERLEDIPRLVNHFLQKHNLARPQGSPLRIDENAMARLLEYQWPGNVRELENAIERAAALCEGQLILERDLPAHIGRSSGRIEDNLMRPVELGLTLDEFLLNQEAFYLDATVRMCKGDRERATRILNISMATFYRKLDAAKKNGLLRENPPGLVNRKRRGPAAAAAANTQPKN
jgi:DNA-binding NtrC family response regulator